MKRKYIQVTVKGLGRYVIPFSELLTIIDGEFDCGEEFAEIGMTVTLEVVEIDEEKYKAFPEFMGW